MSRARILADYVSSGDELADKAPLASPAFTGTPTGITAAHITSGALPVGVTGGSGLDTIPHIIPDVLYPAYEADATGAGKLLDGTTEHGTGTYGGSSVSTSYGTAQSDGRMYYFTNIAGSKPIKDPRIGNWCSFWESEAYV